MNILQNLDDFGQALRNRRHELGLTLDVLAQATGISKPYLSNIETGRISGPPSAEKLTSLAAALQLDKANLLERADWLRMPDSMRKLLPAELPRRADGSINLDAVLYAFGPKTTPDRAAVDVAQPPQALPATGADLQAVPLAHIPLINRVAAGKPSEYTDLDYPVGVADAYLPAPAPPVNSPTSAPARTSPAEDSGMFALRITGDSMEPLYRHGDIVVFSARETPADGDDCLVRLDAQENFSTTFKRVHFLADTVPGTSDQVQLVPLNSMHATRNIAREHITGLYPAVWRISPAPRARDGAGGGGKRRSKRPAPEKSPAENSPPPPATPAPGDFQSTAKPDSAATSRVAIEFD
jgi:transcriptional regulator with XRE-family HTH domain